MIKTVPDINKKKSSTVLFFSIFFFVLVFSAIFIFFKHYSFNWILTDDIVTSLFYHDIFITKKLNLIDMALAWINIHPIGVMGLLSLAVFKFFGINYLIVFWISFFSIALSAVLVFYLIWKFIESPIAKILLGPCLLLILFHPTQMELLVWSAQLGWTLTDLFLILNILLIEKYREKSIPLVAIICILSSFSSAQGSFIWFAAALHFFITQKSHKNLISLFFSIFGVASIFYIFHKGISISGTYSLGNSQVSSLPKYIILFFGSISGVKNHYALLFFSILLFSLLAFIIIEAVRARRFETPERASIVFAFTSFLEVLSFCFGRSKLGIDWATAFFHGAILFIPLLIAILIMAFRLFNRRIVCSLSLAFLLIGFLLGLPFGLNYADFWLMGRGQAMRLTCDEKNVTDPIALANGLSGHNKDLAKVMPEILTMCTEGPSGRAARFLTLPQPYEKMIANNQQDADSLKKLWFAYTTRFDLFSAFPIDDPHTPTKLFQWAKAQPENPFHLQ